ncbi:hypothetical protein GCM10007352_15570 [Mucilaginibacter phyllosphaerae]|nr:hypothetical protein GCM10007352_15570 [Mucilaginibacter phyllosphaerae]
MIAACTKDGYTPDLPGNSYFINSTEHTIDQAGRTANAIIFKDNAGGSKDAVKVEFNTLPVKGGTYTIVAGSAALTENQCRVTVTDAAGGVLYYLGGSDVSAEVIINTNGKLIVNIPEISVAASLPGTTFKLKGSLYEL